MRIDDWAADLRLACRVILRPGFMHSSEVRITFGASRQGTASLMQKGASGIVRGLRNVYSKRTRAEYYSGLTSR